MTYKHSKSNGDTEVIYHNFQVGKHKFSLTTYEVLRLIVKTAWRTIAVLIAAYIWLRPVVNDIQSIPVIRKDVDTVKTELVEVRAWQANVEKRHHIEDSTKISQ